MNAPFESLWAKNHGLSEPYPLAAHMLDAACMAGALYDHWLRVGLRQRLELELGSNARSIVMWLAGTHDIGKANPVFQGQLAARKSDDEAQWAQIRGRIENETGLEFDLGKSLNQAASRREEDLRRHELVSVQYFLDGVNDARFEEAAPGWKAIPSMGHHGRFKLPFAHPSAARRYKKLWTNYLRNSGWASAQHELEVLVRIACRVDESDVPREVPPYVSILLSGLTILADRLVSSVDWVAESQELMVSELTLDDPERWIVEQGSRARETIDMKLGIYEAWDSMSDAKADILGNFDPRPAQQEAQKHPEELLTIMAATGSGKTEAALLRHAECKERLVFLLPTMATSNALMNRVRYAFRNTSNTGSLAHSMATIEDFYDRAVTVFEGDNTVVDTGGLIPSEFVNSGMERMLASVVVGTVDQALKAALPVKWVHLVLLALANAHIVVDEVHTMDAYQSKLLTSLLQWCGTVGARVTLLSATLSKEQCRSFHHAYALGKGQEVTPEAVAFPAIVEASGKTTLLDMDPYTIDYVLSNSREQEIVSSHFEWIERVRQEFPKARIGVICNQVLRAQEVARLLQEKNHQVILLHSAMTADHRRTNSDALLERLGPDGSGEGLIVVGTQVIEASLDIDLDILSTDLCPSASLIQRTGRVWRRRDPRRLMRVPGLNQPLIRVVVPESYQMGSNLPYPEALLQRTQRFLENKQGKIHFPADCQEFVDACTITLEQIVDSKDMDAFAEDALKAMKATDRRNGLSLLLGEDPMLSDFETLTNSEVKIEDLQTRFTEDREPTHRVIVVDDSQEIPGSVTSDFVVGIMGGRVDQSSIQRALQGSINLRERILRSPGVELPYSLNKSLLKQYKFVDLHDFYDQSLGLLSR